jgi:hypothetical protein
MRTAADPIGCVATTNTVPKHSIPQTEPRSSGHAAGRPFTRSCAAASLASTASVERPVGTSRIPRVATCSSRSGFSSTTGSASSGGQRQIAALPDIAAENSYAPGRRTVRRPDGVCRRSVVLDDQSPLRREHRSTKAVSVIGGQRRVVDLEYRLVNRVAHAILPRRGGHA